ncbi:NADP-dependent oxidoreductase [Candidatus Roizmanbacteria bacterium]|nr:NADP-dependent oxidoreductase [Candidatus Roizmanbacteria bacterium]
MKAVQINKYGGSGVFELNQNAPVPTPTEGQVLIKEYAASINPFDWKVREGFFKNMMPLEFPVVLGGDFSGVITEVGEGVSEFKKGDEVFGSANFANGGSGSLAEYCLARIVNIAKKPKNADFLESGASVLVGVSAVQALEEHINLKAKQKILIHGGAGGIGSIAVQLAKVIGAHAATTVSGNDIEFAKSLGANEVIDYKTQGFEKIVKDFDAVFDTVGGETTNKSFQVLKKGGILVSMLGQPDEKLAGKFGITAIGQNTQTNTRHLNRLAELIDNGAIKIQIDKVFPLEKVKEAFDYLEHGSPRGKIGIKIKDL